MKKGANLNFLKDYNRRSLSLYTGKFFKAKRTKSTKKTRLTRQKNFAPFRFRNAAKAALRSLLLPFPCKPASLGFAWSAQGIFGSFRFDGKKANYSENLLKNLQQKEQERRWGTLRKEGAPTALHLTPFRIVLSQSDARYPYGLGDVCFVLFVYNFFVPSWNGFCHIIIPN